MSILILLSQKKAFMTETTQPVLQATTRQEKGKKVVILRKAGLIPAILYGHGVKNLDLAVGYQAFETVYRQTGSSSLIDLQIKGHKPVKTLIQAIQHDPVTGRYLHVDFHQVKMTEKIHAEVNLTFVGESKAVKELGGILVKNVTTLKVECLPEDLVHEIDVDISVLQAFDDIIRVKDLRVPTGIAIKEKDDEVVANVQPPRSEEELKSLEEKPEEKVEEVEKVERKKKEEEGEAASGESATPAPEEKQQ